MDINGLKKYIEEKGFENNMDVCTLIEHLIIDNEIREPKLTNRCICEEPSRFDRKDNKYYDEKDLCKFLEVNLSLIADIYPKLQRVRSMKSMKLFHQCYRDYLKNFKN